MGSKEAWWNCRNCGEKNWVSYDPNELKSKIYACYSCGKVHMKFRPRSSSSNWLDCIRYKGLGSEVPTGVNIEEGTKKMTFGDPNGGDISREDFAKIYTWDPLTVFCNESRNKNHSACKVFLEDRTNHSVDLDLTFDPIIIKPIKPF